MLHDTPLRAAHEAFMQSRASQPLAAAAADRPGAARIQAVKPADLEYLPYGPADSEQTLCEVVASYGEVEAEYAAIRRGAGLMDCPQRGTLLVTGSDRRTFLNNLLTNELRQLEAGLATRAFWLNRKGRIKADLTLIEIGDRLFVDLDIHQAESTVESLNTFLFAEDVTIRDISGEMHRISIFGPRAFELLCTAGGDECFRLDQGCAAQLVIAGHDVVAVRFNQTGDVGIDLLVGYDNARTVWEHLVTMDGTLGKPGERIRPVGWYAYNIARIEAGTPLFNIDFGPTNLPHESGVLNERVSFKKGCYPGQEIVARMHNLGKPKQMLIGLRVESDLLPIAGGQVFACDESGEMGEQIGVVTSSTLSPMLGSTPIAFAMLKTASAEVENTVLVNAEGEQVRAKVQGLRFLPEQ